MPRDLTGNMTLPVGNPVITDTTVSSAVFNATIADLAAEIQDSLSRSGKGGMTAAFEFSDGTVAAPAISFANETSTGMYRSAAGFIDWAIQGVRRMWLEFFGLHVKGALFLAEVGSGKVASIAASPSQVIDLNYTLPPSFPGSTSVLILGSTGAINSMLLNNALQNFGPPSAATDVVINSSLGTATAVSAAANFAATSAKYLKIGQTVFVFGMMTCTNGTADGAQFGTLPAGFRPGTDRIWHVAYFPAAGPAMSASVYCKITSAGVCTVSGVDPSIVNTDVFYLNMFFLAEN
jgi:hypothetical protein